jgi:hypothetical protein
MSAANLVPEDYLESNKSEPFANMESTLFELANSERLSILFRLKEEKKQSVKAIKRAQNLSTGSPQKY